MQILGNVGMLYGSAIVPFSGRVLHPRDTVVIRAVAVCATGGELTSTTERVLAPARP
jgi:hypothetical protein